MANPLTHTASLPCGYHVTFSWIAGNMAVEWEPEFPHIRSKRHWKKFLVAYEVERDDFMKSVATMLGGAVAVADMDGNVKVIAPGVVQ